MKLSKTHTALLADVAAGHVWRTGGLSTGVARVEKPGAKVKDVTEPITALQCMYLVTLGPATSTNPRALRRQYQLTAWGERAVAQ